MADDVTRVVTSHTYAAAGLIIFGGASFAWLGIWMPRVNAMCLCRTWALFLYNASFST